MLGLWIQMRVILAANVDPTKLHLALFGLIPWTINSKSTKTHSLWILLLLVHLWGKLYLLLTSDRWLLLSFIVMKGLLQWCATTCISSISSWAGLQVRFWGCFHGLTVDSKHISQVVADSSLILCCRLSSTWWSFHHLFVFCNLHIWLLPASVINCGSSL